MFDKMKQLMEMKKQAERIKKELSDTLIDVEEVKGIKIVITGAQEFRSIELDESLITTQDKARLEGDLLRSFNAATKKAQNVAAQKMSSLMPGM